MSTSAASSSKFSPATFWRARLGSLLAFLPLSVWTVNHLWKNLAVFSGEEAWQKSVTEYGHPLEQMLVVLIVLLPLVLHTVWGITRILTTRPNNVRYGFFANAKYAFQRLSAIGLLGFLGAHIYLAMLKPRLLEGHPEAFSDIAAHMRHHPPTTIVYSLGVLGIAYHLTNGVSTFAMGWGLVSSKKALRRLDRVTLAMFFVLLAMGGAAIFGLYRAGEMFPVPVE